MLVYCVSHLFRFILYLSQEKTVQKDKPDQERNQDFAKGGT